MSNFGAVDVAQSLETIRISRNTVFAMYALAICEWLEMVPTEIELIHTGSRWTSVKTAYLLCRYYPILLWPLVIYAYGGDHSAHICESWTQAASICLLPMQLCPSGVMLMRAYAFTGRKVKILALLLVLYAGLVSLDVWLFCVHIPRLPDMVYELLGGTGCFPNYGKDRGDRLIVSLSASSGMDLVSLLIIAIYCLRTRSVRGSLGKIFITQGLAAWFAVLMVHVFALAIFFSPSLVHNGVGLPCVIILSNLIACRLILDLRRRALPTETQLLRRHSHLVNQALADRDAWVIEEDEVQEEVELDRVGP